MNCDIYGPFKKKMDLHETGNFTWFWKRKKNEQRISGQFSFQMLLKYI
jgi:hypothetical protein